MHSLTLPPGDPTDAYDPNGGGRQIADHQKKRPFQTLISGSSSTASARYNADHVPKVAPLAAPFLPSKGPPGKRAASQIADCAARKPAGSPLAATRLANLHVLDRLNANVAKANKVAGVAINLEADEAGRARRRRQASARVRRGVVEHADLCSIEKHRVDSACTAGFRNHSTRRPDVPAAGSASRCPYGCRRDRRRRSDGRQDRQGRPVHRSAPRSRN